MTDRPQLFAVHDAALDQEVSGPVLPHDFRKFVGMLFQIASVAFCSLALLWRKSPLDVEFPIEFPDCSDGFGGVDRDVEIPEERRLIAFAGDLGRPTIASARDVAEGLNNGFGPVVTNLVSDRFETQSEAPKTGFRV